MEYFISKKVEGSFTAVMEKTAALLRDEGFGIKTEIDVDGTFREKLGVEYKRYHILGACNPGVAYQAVQAEEMVGVFLPCNVILIEQEPGLVEVATISVAHMMGSIGNPKLNEVAGQIDASLKSVIEKL
ncbi:MAG TPA: DUF302 domain-containing protein [Bacteroidales bacterium]|nr:DUF302 domain-containing protein [Bacteroidales bacterium]